MNSDLTNHSGTLTSHAEQIRRLGKRAFEDIVEIGRLLVEAKGLLPHGNWLPWLAKEFGWSPDTALNFTRIHELAKNRNFRNLNLPLSGAYLLAAPSTPEAVRDEIARRVDAGETISVAVIKATIRAARQAPRPRLTRPAQVRGASEPIPTTAHDITSVWLTAPAEERRRFIDGIGLAVLLESVPTAWIAALTERCVAATLTHRSPSPSLVPLEMPDIPTFLQRTTTKH
jgi:hypothetical protein